MVPLFSVEFSREPAPKRIRFCDVRVELEHIVHWLLAPFRHTDFGTLQLSMNSSMKRIVKRCTPPAVKRKREEVSWVDLDSDVLQLVFAKLPEVSVLRAGSVCRKWHSVTQEPTFIRYYRHSYCSCKRFMFSVGRTKYSLAADLHYGNHDRHNGGEFSFQPLEDCCPIPVNTCTGGNEIPSFQSAGGLHHAITTPAGSRGKGKSTVIRYKNCILDKDWRLTASIPYPVQDAIIGALRSTSSTSNTSSSNSTENGTSSSSNKLILVSGVPLESLGEDDDDLSVSIYDEQTGSWTTCEPPPSEFRGCCASDFMASVVHNGRFYAYDIHTGFVSLLDLESKRWTVTKPLRPSPEPSKLFLVSRPEGLFVVAVQDFSIRDLRFNVWNVIDESEPSIRVGKLVHSSIILNARPPPASAFTRWKSWCLEALSTVVALTLLLIIKLILLVHAWKSRTTSILDVLLNSVNLGGRVESSRAQLPVGGRSALLLYRVSESRRR